MLSSVNLRLIRNYTSLLLALFVLNFALTFHNVWPTLGITTRFELSVEIAILVLALTLYSRLVAKIPSHILTLLALILTVMTFARYIEVTAPALFGRSVNLYWDAQYLPDVARMLAEVANPFQIAMVLAGALLGVTVIFFALRFALVRVTHGFSDPKELRLLSLIMAILTLGYFMGHLNQPIHTLKYYSLPLTKTYWGQVKFISSVMANEASEVIPPGEPLGDFDLSGLKGSDVIVQFIESYGATAYDTASIAEIIAPAQQNFYNSVGDTNRRVVSAFIDSPTFGGNSWLAHASFMTGLDINQLSTYNLLMTQQRTTLSDKFAAQGYQAIALMPGLQADWPEGAFYGFDSIYGAKEIAYKGPEFGWWRIPDQYSLTQLHDIEISKHPRQPLFLLFNTITPHMPFRPTPPYQSDWSRLLTDKPYDQQAVEESLSLLPEWNNLQPAYAGTLAYTFTYLSGYLRNYPDDDFVWVILGDHQPLAAVSGQDVRWDVPVHIVSSNNKIIEDLLQKGFVEGMTPASQPISNMHDLPVTLLSVFSN